MAKKNRNKKKASMKAKRDNIRLALEETGKAESIKRGLQAAAEKFLFVEDKSVSQPTTIEQLSDYKKQQRKQRLNNYKDALDRTRDKIMKPDVTYVAVNHTNHVKNAEEVYLHDLTREVERKSKLRATENREEQQKVKPLKKKKALVTIWDEKDQQEQRDQDEQLLKESFISDLLVRQKKVKTTNDQTMRRKQAKIAQRPVVSLPLSGQSYNPDPESLKRTLEIASLHEARKALKAEKIHEKLTVRDEDELMAEGDDAWAGLLARERPDEPQDPSTIFRPPRPSRIPKAKPTKTKIIGRKIHERNLKRREMRRKLHVETQNIRKFATMADARTKRIEEMKQMRRKIKRELRVRKQAAEKFPVQSVVDVIMPNRIAGNLRNHENNSWSLWYDRLASTHKAGLNEVSSMKKGNIRYDTTIIA